jgi:dTDP-4-dehydrorhamnose reductase
MVRALQILVEKKADGVFHISSPEMHSRLELAVHIAQFFHLDLQHIVPCFIKDLDFSEPRPQYNSLDSTKIIGLYDLEFTSLQDCLHLIKKNYLNAPQFKRAMNF